MTLKIAYDTNSSNLKNQLELLCEQFNIPFEGYTEEIFKERKKAFAIKNIGATRMCPFVVLLNDNGEPKLAWYSENRKCDYEQIKADIIKYCNLV